MKIKDLNGFPIYDESHPSRIYIETSAGKVYEIIDGRDSGRLYVTACAGKQIVVRPSSGTFSQVSIDTDGE